jgi:hypothetical protein
MTYQCPKGHQSTDSDYCSECGALIGQSKISNIEPAQGFDLNTAPEAAAPGQDICPDCGTPRTAGARFCEVCRYDFQNSKTGVAEAIVASQKAVKANDNAAAGVQQEVKPPAVPAQPEPVSSGKASAPAISKPVAKDNFVLVEKLNVIISANRDKAAASDVESDIPPDAVDRVFPLDLDENLVGRRSAGKGIYPEIEINDPGVSRRHLKFIKQPDGSFAVLELGSANGTELNGVNLEPGVAAAVKAGDELNIGIWTTLKLVGR